MKCPECGGRGYIELFTSRMRCTHASHFDPPTVRSRVSQFDMDIYVEPDLDALPTSWPPGAPRTIGGVDSDKRRRRFEELQAKLEARGLSDDEMREMIEASEGRLVLSPNYWILHTTYSPPDSPPQLQPPT